jgi:hypothetical protein
MAFAVGAVVRHRKAADWGLGKVVESHADGKVKVLFQSRRDPVVIAAGLVDTMLEAAAGATWSQAAPSPSAASGKGLKCTTCSRLLRRSIKSKDGEWKSCPNCSGTHGSEHVFRRMPEDFGESEARAAAGVEGGDQSWCYACRSGASTAGGTRLCSQVAT